MNVKEQTGWGLIMLGLAIFLWQAKNDLVADSTYAGKPYDPHVRAELFDRCLSTMRLTGERADTLVRACDLHARDLAIELYATDDTERAP